MRSLPIIAAFILLGAGFGLGASLPDSPDESASAPERSPSQTTLEMRLERIEQSLAALRPALERDASAAPAAASGCSVNESLGKEIARLVSNELRHSVAKDPAPEARQPVEGRETPESQEALSRSQAVVWRALSNRRWSQSDAEELSAQFLSLDGPQQMSVLEALLPAINRGDVGVDPGVEFF
jgi:hypothetical protein